MFRRLQHGETLKKVIAFVKEHGQITATEAREQLGMSRKKANSQLHNWGERGWLTYRGNATFGPGPRMTGERLTPQEGTDDWHIMKYAKDNEGPFDKEDAEIAMDDVPSRATASLRRLVGGGWLVKEKGKYRLAADPHVNNKVKARVDAIVAELRSGIKNFN